jgi:hypothetical protein
MNQKKTILNWQEIINQDIVNFNFTQLNNIIAKLAIVILIGLLSIKCEKDNLNLKHAEGYIVGFNPCTINHHYRIGYVIISTDLKDTLITYNLSDASFKMPASIMLNPSDTLYKIPESYFQNYRNSAYLPIETRFDYKVKVTYAYATEVEKIFHECSADFNQGDFSNQFLHNQVIIKSLSK